MTVYLFKLEQSLRSAMKRLDLQKAPLVLNFQEKHLKTLKSYTEE